MRISQQNTTLPFSHRQRDGCWHRRCVATQRARLFFHAHDTLHPFASASSSSATLGRCRPPYGRNFPKTPSKPVTNRTFWVRRAFAIQQTLIRDCVFGLNVHSSHRLFNFVTAYLPRPAFPHYGTILFSRYSTGFSTRFMRFS